MVAVTCGLLKWSCWPGTYVSDGDQTVTGVYSSNTGLWGDLTSTVLPDKYKGICMDISSSNTLVGSTRYWLSSSAIVAFDTDKQRLAVIENPFRAKRVDSVQIIQGEDDGLGLAAFRGLLTTTNAASKYGRGILILMALLHGS
jgi:hypothetical protein